MLSFSKARLWLRWGQTLVSSEAFQIGMNQAAAASGVEQMQGCAHPLSNMLLNGWGFGFFF